MLHLTMEATSCGAYMKGEILARGDEMSDGANAIENINVGLADGDLRFCIATETVRQGELRLALQQSNIQAAEARATSILGWSATAISALAVVMLDSSHRSLALPSILILFVGALACIVVLWPKTWHGPGYTTSDIQVWNLNSELELKESLASGYETASAHNRSTLRRCAFFMAVAWICLATAPIVGAAMVLGFSLPVVSKAA